MPRVHQSGKMCDDAGQKRLRVAEKRFAPAASTARIEVAQEGQASPARVEEAQESRDEEIDSSICNKRRGECQAPS